MDEVKEFNIEDLSDEELFEGLNDDIPDEEAEQDAEESDKDEETDAVDEEEDADQQESSDEDDSEEPEDKETEEEEKEEAPDQKFTLKHLDEVREVDRDEVVALAQKGMDYDRIRTERDALKANEAELEEYRSFLKRIAGDQSIEDLIDSTLAKLDVADAEAKGEELDEVEQFKKLRIERVKREAKNPKPAPEEEKTPEDAEKERLSKSIQRFIKEYPDVKATDVPPEVWKDYRDGRADLVECWELHENKKLKEELKALKQNQKNKERSTGSKKSAGKKAVDPWFDGWPDD
jgi:hypothetical protein